MKMTVQRLFVQTVGNVREDINGGLLIISAAFRVRVTGLMAPRGGQDYAKSQH